MEIEKHINKQVIRKKYLAYRDEQTETACIRKSAEIVSQLKELPCFREAEIILPYINYGSEVITEILVEEVLIKNSKRVFTPAVKDLIIDFFEITHMNDLTPGYKGIKEPPQEEIKRFTHEHLKQYRCLMIMPGVAFDRERNRMGYGRGYYDRFLAGYPSLKTVALAFDCQIAPEIITQPHDIKPEIIITESIRI